MTAFDWRTVWPGCETVTLVLTKAEAAALRSRARMEGRLRAGGKVVLSAEMATELAFEEGRPDEPSTRATPRQGKVEPDPKIAILPVIQQVRVPGDDPQPGEPAPGEPAPKSARVLFFTGVKRPQPRPARAPGRRALAPAAPLDTQPDRDRRSILDETPPRAEPARPAPVSGLRFLPGRGRVKCAELTHEQARAEAAKVAAAIAAGAVTVTACPPRTFVLTPELEAAYFHPRHHEKAMAQARRRMKELLEGEGQKA
jgi:hypothetical protein